MICNKKILLLNYLLVIVALVIFCISIFDCNNCSDTTKFYYLFTLLGIFILISVIFIIQRLCCIYNIDRDIEIPSDYL